MAVGACERSSPRFCHTNDNAAIAALHACSACAGDYEDPERTGWPDDEEADDLRENAEGTSVDEFPAGQE